MNTRRNTSLILLCALMGGSGVLHFLLPGPYRGIVPAMLRPWSGTVVAVSGVGELVCAALLAIPRTRWIGALATTALLVAVFPANVQMALDSHSGRSAVLAWARLPLQVPLVLWAWSFRR